jgi:hypothetical protein
MSGKSHSLKVIVQFIHDRLDHSRGIDSRGMANEATPGLNDVGETAPVPPRGNLCDSPENFLFSRSSIRGFNFAHRRP